MSTEVREQYEATLLELRRRKANALAWKAETLAHRSWLRHDARIFQERADEAELAITVVKQLVGEL